MVPSALAYDTAGVSRPEIPARADDLVVLVCPADDSRCLPRVLYVNHAVEQLLKATHGSLLSDGWMRHTDVVANSTALQVLARRMHEHAALNEPLHAEFSWHSSDQQTLWFDVAARAVRLKDMAHLVHWEITARSMNVQRDVVERSAQSQRLESLGLLAGSIAHDFGNLVQVVTGFTQLALTRLAPDDPARVHVHTAHEAAVRAVGLSRQLLTFTRRQAVTPGDVELGALLHTLYPVLERLAGPSVNVLLNVHDDTQAIVWADPTQLEQVLMNLVVNAREAQPHGGEIVVQLDVFAARVRLRVADRGHGMNAEVRSHVFEPFFTTKPHGTGLGLSTVYGIVRQCGGDVQLYSPPGGGLTVDVMLPRWETPP